MAPNDLYCIPIKCKKLQNKPLLCAERYFKAQHFRPPGFVGPCKLCGLWGGSYAPGLLSLDIVSFASFAFLSI